MRDQEIEVAIAKLTPQDSAGLAVSREEYWAQTWDDQIARDAGAWRFEPLIQRAREQLWSGQGKTL